jgi:hypothetical protein
MRLTATWVSHDEPVVLAEVSELEPAVAAGHL